MKRTEDKEYQYFNLISCNHHIVMSSYKLGEKSEDKRYTPYKKNKNWRISQSYIIKLPFVLINYLKRQIIPKSLSCLQAIKFSSYQVGEKAEKLIYTSHEKNKNEEYPYLILISTKKNSEN